MESGIEQASIGVYMYPCIYENRTEMFLSMLYLFLDERINRNISF